MPVFDYVCKKCGFEDKDLRVSRHDDKVDCQKCKAPMTKKICAPNIVGMDNLGRSKPK